MTDSIQEYPAFQLKPISDTVMCLDWFIRAGVWPKNTDQSSKQSIISSEESPRESSESANEGNYRESVRSSPSKLDQLRARLKKH
jgi:hypothetical protein